MNDIDLSGQPHWTEQDRTIMPTVEPSLLGIRRVTVGWIGRLNAGMELYAPVPDVEQGGTLELGQAQVRHLYAEFGKMIKEWDTEPRDLAEEADKTLSSAGRRFTSRARASEGYEVETDGAAVYVYHSDRGEYTAHNLTAYADALSKAGYTGPKGASAPVIEGGSEDIVSRVHAVPPAAESF